MSIWRESEEWNEEVLCLVREHLVPEPVIEAIRQGCKAVRLPCPNQPDDLAEFLLSLHSLQFLPVIDRAHGFECARVDRARSTSASASEVTSRHIGSLEQIAFHGLSSHRAQRFGEEAVTRIEIAGTGQTRLRVLGLGLKRRPWMVASISASDAATPAQFTLEGANESEIAQRVVSEHGRPFELPLTIAEDDTETFREFRRDLLEHFFRGESDPSVGLELADPRGSDPHLAPFLNDTPEARRRLDDLVARRAYAQGSLDPRERARDHVVVCRPLKERALVDFLQRFAPCMTIFQHEMPSLPESPEDLADIALHHLMVRIESRKRTSL